MKYLVILAMILTMQSVAGSEVVIASRSMAPNPAEVELNSTSIERPIFSIRLKVNGNLVFNNNNNLPAVFSVSCDRSMSSRKISEVVINKLISYLRLDGTQIESVSFVFMGSPERHLAKFLRDPSESIALSCIPVCELITEEFPKKVVVRDKILHNRPLFLFEDQYGRIELGYKEFYVSEVGETK